MHNCLSCPRVTPNGRIAEEMTRVLRVFFWRMASLLAFQRHGVSVVVSFIHMESSCIDWAVLGRGVAWTGTSAVVY